MVDQQHLSLLFSCYAAQGSLLDVGEKSSHLHSMVMSVEQLCRLLCKHGLANKALIIASQAVRFSNDLTTSVGVDVKCSSVPSLNLLELVLVLQQRNFPQQKRGGVVWKSQQNRFLHDLLTTVPWKVSYSSLVDMSDRGVFEFHQLVCWEHLSHILQHIDHPHRLVNIIASSHLSTSTSITSDTPLPLSISRHPTISVSSSFQLMQTFLRFDSLEDACDLASHVVLLSDTSWLSYNVLDEVIEVVEHRIKEPAALVALNGGGEERKKILKKKINRLKGLLEQHFLSGIIDNV